MQISIVVVTWNNENYIEQAIRSCFQDPEILPEVIVVNNGSEDRTAEVAERASALHPGQVKIITLPSNEGPGVARNTGLAATAGDYVMFLDGDDFLAPGAIRRVAECIAQHRPDVLLYNHGRFWNTGKVSANSRSKLLYERDASDPENRRSLMRNFSVAWNKAYRRDFLTTHGFHFMPGIYEDVSWNFGTQIKAETFYVIPDVLVRYRQRANSITRSMGRQHFDVFTEYGLVRDILKASPEATEAYGKTIYSYGRNQILHIFGHDSRLPNEVRSEYLKRAGQFLSGWRRDVGIRGRDIAISAATTGNSQLFAAALWAKDTKAALIEKRSALKSWLLKAIWPIRRTLRAWMRPRLFGLASKVIPVKPKKVMFESYWGAKADCNPLAIARELHKIGGYDIVWSLKNGAFIPKDFPFRIVERGSLRMLLEAVSTETFFSNTNLIDEIGKRRASTHVQTWHGTPIKLMGIDIRPFKPKEMNWALFAKRSERWDYVVSSNPHSSYAWRSGCPFEYKMLETGYPRNDIFFKFTPDDVARIRRDLVIPEGKKVALYAPTVRDDLKGKPLPVEPSVFDAQRVQQALGDDWVVLVRAHYFLKGAARQVTKGVIDASQYAQSNEVAIVSDLLITDYSSLMFDYACLRRPIVIYGYDIDHYHATRGTYFDIRDKLPGPFAGTQDDLLAVLEQKQFQSDEAKAQINRFSDEFCPWDDGNATRRVIEQTLGRG